MRPRRPSTATRNTFRFAAVAATMSLVAEFTIPPEALPFGDTLVDKRAVRIEVKRIVPTHESALPFFWVWGSDPEQFMAAAEREPDVTDTRLLERVEDGALFRAEWSPNAAVINGLEQLEATIVESEGTAERWRFEVRAEDRDTFARLQRVFREEGIPVSLDRLFSPSGHVAAGLDGSITFEFSD